MKNLSKQTKSLSEKEIIRTWHLIDANGKILGRLSPVITKLLQGKNKTNYVPYLDTGDYVVVINAKNISISGKKNKTKIYTSYSGYPGGLRRTTYESLKESNPTEILKHAVSGMLPKNKFRDTRLKRLYIFADNQNRFKDKFNKLKN